MAEEWIDDAQNEAKDKASHRAKADKALGAAEHKNKELVTKLAAEKSSRLNAEAGLKNVEAQVEDQHKKLNLMKIELATQRKLILKLKANLQKAKEAARAAKEVAEPSKPATYDRGV